jgi:hypothetical protein
MPTKAIVSKARDLWEQWRSARGWRVDLRDQQALLLRNLLLAELVAKVTYNSTNPPDEFDEDSGWWVAPCLKDILDFVDDEQFSTAAWAVLTLSEQGA